MQDAELEELRFLVGGESDSGIHAYVAFAGGSLGW